VGIDLSLIELSLAKTPWERWVRQRLLADAAPGNQQF
jgi:hypothetical protein